MTKGGCKMRIGAVVILVFVALLCVLGFVLPLLHHQLVDPNYLLTVIATAGMLGGLAFALYGWYTSREIPNMIERETRQKTDELRREFSAQFYRQQEAMQKVIASYQLQDPDAKIELLQRAVAQDPTVYNAFVALGYVYWYDKDDFLSAEACFRKDLEFHPDNYQSASDLAALHAHYGEYRTALRWMKQAVDMRPETRDDFEQDARFNAVRTHHAREYNHLIRDAR